MPQIDDCIASSVGGAKDGLLTYYQTNGATATDLQDAERQFLIARGISNGDLDDMWETYLVGKGYLGSVADMKMIFWCTNNGVP